MAGPALTDLLLGKVSPSGKLPITFPRAAGQIPLYYNKKNGGRPNDTHEYIPLLSGYMDIDSTPLFPYGFGLSYSSFSYSDFKMSQTTIGFGEDMTVSATVTNDGDVSADEIAFLFVRDLVGSLTRPVKELKDFERVTLSPGESKTVSFVVNSEKLKFWTKNKEFAAEAGKFHVWIGKNVQEGLQGGFELV
jgi:beta-glucosidase